MADLGIFVATTVGAVLYSKLQERSSDGASSSAGKSQSRGLFLVKEKKQNRELFLVDEHNEALQASGVSPTWCRATYSLVIHEPPHLYYEPKDWSCTTILLLRPKSSSDAPLLRIPGGPLWKNENYHESTIRHLLEDTAIDVCQPENCLHHLFTFPFEGKAAAMEHVVTSSSSSTTTTSEEIKGVWGDFYECVYRGKVEDLQQALDQASSSTAAAYSFVTMTLNEVQDALTETEQESSDGKEHDSATSSSNKPSMISFTPDTLHALKLYFQRQGDLRVQRRLLKGYSSADLEHYGLRSPQERAAVPILRDMQDDHRQAAVDFTLKTDDGMSPRLLPQADLVILGVSRAGKTPLSILIAQTMGLKVANIPLVWELEPPQQLLRAEPHHGKRRHNNNKDTVDPRRVFCLTIKPEYLQQLRSTRLRRELKKQLGQGQSIYATLEYIKKDVQKAKDLCLTYGFTEIDVTGRAMEETASLIVSKLKERFPDETTRAQSVHLG